MGLFRKKTIIEDKNNASQTDLSNEIEIVDFSSDTNVVNTIETKKEKKVLIIILCSIIFTALLLPTVTNIFKKPNKIITQTPVVSDIVYNDTVNNKLEINVTKGNIVVKDIKFYNFSKKNDNQITLLYLPNREIEDVNEENIYIELYNKNNVVTYRTKFINNKKLLKKNVGVINLNVTDDIYEESIYGSLRIIKDEEFNSVTDILVCNHTDVKDSYNYTEKRTFNFSDNGLISYEINKSVEYKEVDNSQTEEEINDSENAQIENEESIQQPIVNTINFEESFKKEAEILSKEGVLDLTYDKNMLEYKVELLTFKSNDIKVLYNLSSTKREIKYKHEKESWDCH